MTGLLTFTEADNYGALLQAYALQTTLKKLGYDSVFLNLKKGVETPQKDLSKLPPAIRKKIEETITHHKIRAKKFAEFRNNYLNITDYISSNDISELNNKYNRFIVGSDQVWNFGLTDGELLYTLPFADKEKRFSYAASFGGKEGIEKATDSFWKELTNFNKISLRENDGVDIVKTKTGITPIVNIDPCMLLTKEEWEVLLTNEETIEEKYILLFLIEYDAEFYAKAKELAESKKLPLKIVTASYIPQFGFEAYSGTSVTKWLRLIHDAEYVLCDSFHGSVFSIIFEKKFMPNLSKTKLEGRSSRLTNLLDKLDLKSEEINCDVDYRNIKNIINNEKKKSLTYLNSIYE